MTPSPANVLYLRNKSWDVIPRSPQTGSVLLGSPYRYICSAIFKTIQIMRVKHFIISAAALIALPGGIYGQAIAPHYQKALSLYGSEAWGSAKKEFSKARQEPGVTAEAVDFYEAICRSKLNEKQAVRYLEQYVATYPYSAHSSEARFELAGYYYASGEWETSAGHYVTVNPDELSARQKDEYNFKLGYALFMSGDHARAYKYFAQVAPKSEYNASATYYLAYIDYENGNYTDAKARFRSLSSQQSYGKLTGYYLLQIEYLEGNYRYVTENGDVLLREASSPRNAEIARLMGESWFRLADYGHTLQYMDKYRSLGGEMGRNEYYLAGYSDYMNHNYKAAAEAFVAAANGNDALAQNASYHLADCYIKLGDKTSAMKSFSLAAATDYNPEITEDALFNCGKLQYELGSGVFNEAINLLTRYIATYPGSKRTPVAREYLIAAYYNSYNYTAAYEAIKQYPNPDNNLKKAFQKIAYFHALEYFNRGDYTKAASLLEQSASSRSDAKYTALATYWRGEILFRQGEYEKASDFFREYLKLSPDKEFENRVARYNIGYGAFNTGQWTSAREWFDNFLNYPSNDALRADTYNRLGDIDFAERSYWKAIENYDKAIKTGTGQKYYAQYQRAVMLGLVDRGQRKVETLQDIIKAGEGDYVDKAMYELGRTYIAQEQYKDAVVTLAQFTSRYPASPAYPAALSALGLSYQNLKDNKQALECYKKVVTEAKGSPEARDAMSVIQSIYVEMNDVEAYFAFARESGVETDMNIVRRDSLAWASAQNVYLTGSAAKSVTALEGYLKNYDRGAYRPQALYYLAESRLRAGNRVGSISALEELTSIYNNDFTVKGLEKLSALYFEDKEWGKAAPAYKRLAGVSTSAETVAMAQERYLMSVSYTGDPKRAISAADELLAAHGLSTNVARRAKYVKACALQALGEASQANRLWADLAGEGLTAEGAEATYRMIEAAYAARQSDKAEKMVLAFAAQNTTQQYWLGRAFLILGDIYAGKGDAFQAKATYQSIVDGYSPADDGIVDQAKERLGRLKSGKL